MQTYIVTFWTEDCGDEAEFFRCQADDQDHAAEQCANAYPGCDILEILQEKPE